MRSGTLPTLALTFFLSGLALAGGTTVADAPPEPLFVDGFEDGDLASDFGTSWTAYDDGYLQGGSNARIAVVPADAAGGGQALRVEGEVGEGFRSPFAGVSVLLDGDGATRDLSQYRGVRFNARGDGGRYQLQVLTGVVQDFNEFSGVFLVKEDWDRFEIPFGELAQSPYWGRQVEWTSEQVRGLAFRTVPQFLGDFRLEVDGVEFF